MFVEDYVEWFVNEFLETDTYRNDYFKNEIEIKPNRIGDNDAESASHPGSTLEFNGWLCGKYFISTKRCLNCKKIGDPHIACSENRIVKKHCQLTGKITGLEHNECNLNTRKAHSSSVPLLFHNSSEYDFHLNFHKMVNMAIEKDIKIKGEENLAKKSGNCKSVYMRNLKFLDSYIFSDASLDELSTILKSFSSLDANGMEHGLLGKKLAYPYEKGRTSDSFQKPIKLGREEYFCTLKQSYPHCKETISTEAIIVKN